MGQLHFAMTGTATGAVALAAAGAVPGTLVDSVSAAVNKGSLQFGRPSGTLLVGVQAVQEHGHWRVTKVVMGRSGRRLMEGHVFVPSQA